MYVTDSAGSYLLRLPAPAGGAPPVLRISRIGYELADIPLPASSGEVRIDAVLQPSRIQLEGIVVVPDRPSI